MSPISMFPAPGAVYAVYGGRNVIRNGDFSVWQRGTSYAPGLSANVWYGPADGWILDMSASAGGTQIYRGDPGLGVNTRWWMSIQTVGQTTTTSMVRLQHRIENVNTFQGQTATLSFDSGALGAANIGIEIVQNFGTGGTPSAEFSPTLTLVVPAGLAMQRQSITFAVPSTAGKARGTNNNDYLAINFWLSAGSVFNANASNIGLQNNTFNIGRVQLELGTVATPFEQISQQQQLAWCQRYFVRLGGDGSGASNSLVGNGVAMSATQLRVALPLMATLRASPTVTLSGTVVATNGIGTAAVTAAGSGLIFWSKYGACWIDFVSSTFATGNPVFIYTGSALTDSVSLSAEL